MTDDFCICERCGQPGSLALFRSPVPVSATVITLRGGIDQVQHDCHAVALCVPCGQQAGFPRFFDRAGAALQKALAG